jgi:hypothetical protein
MGDVIYVGQQLRIPQVAVVLDSIVVSVLPGKVQYTVGDVLDLTGLVVTAVYSNGDTRAVSGYTVIPVSGAVLSSAGVQNVSVSYVEAGVTRFANFTVDVSAKQVIKSLTATNSALVKQGSGNNGYGETTVTLSFELPDGTSVVEDVFVSGIKWGVNTVSEVTYNIGGYVVTVTITIVPTGNNFNQLTISSVTATYVVSANPVNPDADIGIKSLSHSYSELVRQGTGNSGYGETIVTLNFELFDSAPIVENVRISNIKWGVNTVQEVTYRIGGHDVAVTITIVPTGNNLNQLSISNVNVVYTVR